MGDWHEQQLTLWMNLACDLREFIEYGGVKLTPAQEREYREICKKYEEGDDYNKLEEEYGVYLLG